MIRTFVKRLLFVMIFIIHNQQYGQIKKWNCLKLPFDKVREIDVLDTLFILYQKSDNPILYQNKVYNRSAEEFDYYAFGKHFLFPMQIFDVVNWKKVNFREPKIMYKSKKFICKNMYRTIDAQYIVNWGHFFCKKGCNEKMIIFIIELDISINNYYRITQVGTPIISTF